MLDSNKDVLQKMRHANIPAFALGTTLVQENAHALRAIVQGREFKQANALASYVLRSSDVRVQPLRATRFAAIMGKELVLAGQKVKFIPLAGLVRELRLTEYGDEPHALIDVHAMVGSGYFVIPDFDDEIANPEMWPETQAFLTTHLNRGGGVILVVRNDWVVPAPKFTGSFAAVAESFVYMEV